MDNGNSAIGIYLDLTKAFDLVSHEILLYKLNYYGVRGKVLNWFKSYLNNREQYTCVNNTYSKPPITNLRVAQGFVLGPLLFLIYVNDIQVLTTNTEIRLFADDTNVFIFNKDIILLQQLASKALSKLTEWFNRNRLSVNLSKTCFSVFSKKTTKHIQELSWNENIIKRVPVAKYLGVHVDENLSWKQHIDFVCQKISKLTYVFRVLSKYINKSQICQLYYAYVYPHIYYAIELYGACSYTDMKSLQVTQNNLLRVLCNVNYRYSATKMHVELGLNNINKIFQTAVLVFVYKQRSNILPLVFNKYYQSLEERNNLRSRQSSNL